MTEEITGPRGKPTIDLLNGIVVKFPSKYYIYTSKCVLLTMLVKEADLPPLGENAEIHNWSKVLRSSDYEC